MQVNMFQALEVPLAPAAEERAGPSEGPGLPDVHRGTEAASGRREAAAEHGQHGRAQPDAGTI